MQELKLEVIKVWAIPHSLATTNGIVVYFLFLEVLRCFSSPGSLSLSYVFRQVWLDMTLAGFPHSEIFGSKLARQLPEAYRSPLRPSSVTCVKASVMCAWVTSYDSLSYRADLFPAKPESARTLGALLHQAWNVSILCPHCCKTQLILEVINTSIVCAID